MNDKTKKMILKLFMDNGIDDETIKIYSDYYRKIYQPNTAIIYSCRVEYEWAQLFLYLNGEKSYEEILEDNNKNNIMDGIGYNDYLKKVSDRMIEVSKTEGETLKVIFTDTLPNSDEILNQMIGNLRDNLKDYLICFGNQKIGIKNCQIEYQYFRNRIKCFTHSQFTVPFPIIINSKSNAFNKSLFEKLFARNRIIYFIKYQLNLVHKKVAAKSEDERKIKIIIENILLDMLYDNYLIFNLYMLNNIINVNFNKYIKIDYDKMLQSILSKIHNISLSKEDKINFINNYLSDLNDRGFINIYTIGNKKYLQITDMLFFIRYVRYYIYSYITEFLIEKNIIIGFNIEKSSDLKKTLSEIDFNYDSDGNKIYYSSYYCKAYDIQKSSSIFNKEFDDMEEYIKYINYVFLKTGSFDELITFRNLTCTGYYDLFDDMGLYYSSNDTWNFISQPIKILHKWKNKCL